MHAQKDYKKWFNDMHKKLGQLEMECTSRKKLGYNKAFFQFGNYTQLPIRSHPQVLRKKSKDKVKH